MPFKSEKQRRYMHAKLPKIAKRWEKEYKDGGLTKVAGYKPVLGNNKFGYPSGGIKVKK